MKRVVMMMAALTIAATGFAQHRHPHYNRQGQRGPGIKETLGLDSAQYATIKGINRKYHQKARTIRMDTSQSFDLKRKEFKSLQDARQKEITTVLTPEQHKKWETAKKERKEKRQEATKARKQHRDDRIKSNLSINDEQLEKMRKARKESFDKAQSDYEKKLKSILTEEQFKKWKEMDGKRKRAR
jgi:Spy/CpxP family protein refolding chaperone